MSDRRPRESEEQVRPGYLTDSQRRRYSPHDRAANDGGGLVLVPLEQLLASIKDAVGEAMGQGPGARLLDKATLAQKLDCSPAMINKLMLQGLPCLYVGTSPRFDYDAVVRWMAEAGPAPKEGEDKC